MDKHSVQSAPFQSKNAGKQNQLVLYPLSTPLSIGKRENFAIGAA
jgi:hypothetical protein